MYIGPLKRVMEKDKIADRQLNSLNIDQLNWYHAQQVQYRMKKEMQNRMEIRNAVTVYAGL